MRSRSYRSVPALLVMSDDQCCVIADGCGLFVGVYHMSNDAVVDRIMLEIGLDGIMPLAASNNWTRYRLCVRAVELGLKDLNLVRSALPALAEDAADSEHTLGVFRGFVLIWRFVLARSGPDCDVSFSLEVCRLALDYAVSVIKRLWKVLDPNGTPIRTPMPALSDVLDPLEFSRVSNEVDWGSELNSSLLKRLLCVTYHYPSHDEFQGHDYYAHCNDDRDASVMNDILLVSAMIVQVNRLLMHIRNPDADKQTKNVVNLEPLVSDAMMKQISTITWNEGPTVKSHPGPTGPFPSEWFNVSMRTAISMGLRGGYAPLTVAYLALIKLAVGPPETFSFVLNSNANKLRPEYKLSIPALCRMACLAQVYSLVSDDDAKSAALLISSLGASVPEMLKELAMMTIIPKVQDTILVYLSNCPDGYLGDMHRCWDTGTEIKWNVLEQFFDGADIDAMKWLRSLHSVMSSHTQSPVTSSCDISPLYLVQPRDWIDSLLEMIKNGTDSRDLNDITDYSNVLGNKLGVGPGDARDNDVIRFAADWVCKWNTRERHLIELESGQTPPGVQLTTLVLRACEYGDYAQIDNVISHMDKDEALELLKLIPKIPHSAVRSAVVHACCSAGAYAEDTIESLAQAGVLFSSVQLPIERHRQAVMYMIKNDLVFSLIVYLECHSLALSRVECSNLLGFDVVLENGSLESWARVLFLMRLGPEYLYDMTLANSDMFKDMVIDEYHYIAALSLSPSIGDHMAARPLSLGGYPIFQSIADNHGQPSDIDSVDLNEALINTLPEYVTQLIPVQELNFSHSSLSKYCYEEVTDVCFFLKHNRPSRALHYLINEKLPPALRAKALASHTDTECFVLPVEFIKSSAWLTLISNIYDIAYTSAVRDGGVTVCCLAFLMVLGLTVESESLALHCSVARRIMQGHAVALGVSDDVKAPDELGLLTASQVIDAIKSNKSTQLLSWLQSATVLMVQTGKLELPSRATDCVISDDPDASIDAYVQRQLNKYNTKDVDPSHAIASDPWELVIKYCQYHDLKPSYSWRVCSTNNEVLHMLIEASHNNMDMTTLHSVISENILDPTIRSHVMIGVFKELLVSPRSSSQDVLTVLNKSGWPRSTSEFLDLAKSTSRPFFCILATTVTNNGHSLGRGVNELCECLDTYLSLCTPRAGAYIDDAQMSLYGGDRGDGDGGQCMTSLRNTVRRLMRTGMSGEGWKVLEQGWMIFDSASPLTVLFKALRYFSLHRYDDSHAMLITFMQMQQQYEQLNIKIGDQQWIKNIALECAHAEYVFRCQSVPQQSKFLSVLASLNFHTSFVHLARSHAILHRADIPPALQLDADAVLGLLISKGMFNEARQYAEFTHSVDRVTIAEVESIVSDYNNTPVWDTEEGRIGIWSSINALFDRYSISPDLAGDFFYFQTDKIPNDRVAEEVYLLKLATTWYSSRDEDTRESSDDQDKYVLEHSMKRNTLFQQFGGKEAFLRHLENRLWLTSVGMEAIHVFRERSRRSRRSRKGFKDSESNVAVTKDDMANELDSIDQTLHDDVSETDSDDDVIIGVRTRDNRSKARASELSNIHPAAMHPGELVHAEGVMNESPDIDVSELSTLDSTNPMLAHVMITLGVDVHDNESSGYSTQNTTAAVASQAQFLEMCVGRLLEKGLRAQARQIVESFGLHSLEYSVIQSMYAIADSEQQLVSLPSGLALQALTKRNPQLGTYSSLSPARLLKLLSTCCIYAQACARQIYTNHAVAAALSLSFSDVVTRSHLITLENLLKLGSSYYDLVGEFVSNNNLDARKTASVLANVWVNNVRSLKNVRPSDIQSPAEYTKYVMLCSDVAYVGYEMLSLLPDLENIPEAPEEHEEFPDVLDAMDRERGVERSESHVWEVETVIAAHTCFVMSCCVDGVDRLLRWISSRVHVYVSSEEFPLLVRLLVGLRRFNEMEYVLDLLVENDQFELTLVKASPNTSGDLKQALVHYLMKQHPPDAVRLEMVFLRFGMLREIAETLYNRAETSLRECVDGDVDLLDNVSSGTPEEYSRTPSSSVPIRSYKQSPAMQMASSIGSRTGARPTSAHRMSGVVFERVGSFRPGAFRAASRNRDRDASEDGVMANVKLGLRWNDKDDVNKILVSAGELYLQAAESFSVASCFDAERRALDNAQLLLLQIKLLPSRIQVVLLTQQQAVDAMCSRSKFSESYTISRAYNIVDWVKPVVVQVIENANTDYMTELVTMVPLNNAFFFGVIETTRHRLGSHLKPNVVQNLGYVLKLAKDTIGIYKAVIKEFGSSCPELVAGLSNASGVREVATGSTPTDLPTEEISLLS